MKPFKPDIDVSGYKDQRLTVDQCTAGFFYEHTCQRSPFLTGRWGKLCLIQIHCSQSCLCSSSSCVFSSFLSFSSSICHGYLLSLYASALCIDIEKKVNYVLC